MTKIKRVYLEITDICNLDCPFCTNSKGNTFMPFEEIKDYLSQIKSICDYVYLHVLGEPTLHPNFEEILDYCDKLHLNVQLVTNGTLLCQYPNLFQHESLRKCSISLHSINNTLQKEEYFLSILELINKPINTIIELRFYNMQSLDNDLKTFLYCLENSFGFKTTNKTNSYRLKENVYIYFNDLFDWPNIEDPFISDKGKCHGAIEQIAILHDSKVTCCCLDPKGYNTIGDLKKNSLKEILASDNYQNAFIKFKNNIFVFELCQKCSYRTRFK